MSCDNVNSSCCMAVTTSFLALPFLCQLLTKEHVNAALTLHSSLLVWLLPVSLPRATLASALSPYVTRSGSECWHSHQAVPSSLLAWKWDSISQVA